MFGKGKSKLISDLHSNHFLRCSKLHCKENSQTEYRLLTLKTAKQEIIKSKIKGTRMDVKIDELESLGTINFFNM